MVLKPGGARQTSRETRVPVREEVASPVSKELYLQLLSSVKKQLYNFVRKALNFSADADDLFQEALLKGYRYFYSYNRAKNFKTWIFTIAHNLVKDYHRRHTTIPLEDGDKIAANHVGTPPREVLEIYEAAGKLKPRDREVFFLYYYNDFKIAEIAQITGLSPFNVKFILHRSRQYLKEILEVET